MIFHIFFLYIYLGYYSFATLFGCLRDRGEEKNDLVVLSSREGK